MKPLHKAALDAGLSGVYAYPGTPSTEITEYIQMAPITSERNIHSRWSSNEKTAMETALGMSFAGKACLGMHETCGHERGCRLLHQLGHHRSKGRTHCHCCRRPQYALVAKRTRQPLLWRLLASYRCTSPVTNKRLTIWCTTVLSFPNKPESPCSCVWLHAWRTRARA